MATVNLSDYKPLQITNADSFRIGIVVSDWNDFVTYNLRDAAIEILEKEGVKKENIEFFLFLERLNLILLVCNFVQQKITML
jgi:6,7-dimethyl-8-ribityllumazine synthase